MDDRRLGLAGGLGAGDLAGGDQGGDRGRGDRLAALVHDEAAVGVAVEGQAQVGADLADLGLQVDQVLRVERVGLVVGEGAVQLEVHRDELDRQAVEDGRHGVAAHAVAGVHRDLERADRGEVDEAEQVVGVAAQGVLLGEHARLHALGRDRDGVVLGGPGLDQLADLGQAGVLADRGGAGPAQLDAVVLGRVVAGGEHRAGQVELAAGVVELVGRAEPDLHHVGTVGGGALGEGQAQRRGGGAHVVADHDRGRAGDLHERGTEGPGQALVPLVRDDASDVVRLDELLEVAHCGSTLVSGLNTSGPPPVRSTGAVAVDGQRTCAGRTRGARTASVVR